MDTLRPAPPYHILQTIGSTLLGVRGPNIDLINLFDGSLQSTWKCAVNQTGESSSVAINDSVPSVSKEDEQSGSLIKKRKLSESENELKKEDKPTKRQKKANKTAQAKRESRAPNFTALKSTSDHTYVVGVTSEDKCIRVFKLQADETGRSELKEISERMMPKKPCAIAITKDDLTILSADKFGDVWSLPLLPLLEDKVATASQDAKISTISPPRSFVPAANELTVHSERNKRALKNQRRQTKQAPEQREPTFEKELLLGHVSMLTDLVTTRFNDRDYIITSDRDEHIRVSRGIPQTYVIEKFLLGHREFITRLCVPRERPEILLSGGGDETLISWDLASTSDDSIPLSCLNIRDAADIASIRKENAAQLDEDIVSSKVLISGVHHFRMPLSHESFRDIIIIVCEGIAALFACELSIDGKLKYLYNVPLPANPIAVASITNMTTLEEFGFFVSLDNVHRPGTTQSLWNHIDGDCWKYRLVKIVLRDGKLVSTAVDWKLDAVHAMAGRGPSIYDLSSFLYPLESLRKREGNDGGQGDRSDQAIEHE